MKRILQFEVLALAVFGMAAFGCGSSGTVATTGGDSIFSAAEKGDIEAVSKAIRGGGGFKVDTPDGSGKTVLHYAVIGNQQSLVEVLLDYDANVAVKDAEGRTPLDYAEQAGNSAIIEALRRAGGG